MTTTTTMTTATARLPRVAFKVKVSPRLVVSGLVGGLSIVVLLQQFAVLFPSLALLLGAAVGGAVVLVALANALHYLAVQRLNGRLAVVEQRLDQRATAAYRVPETGLVGYAEPDPSGEAQRQLAAGETVQVGERRGDWASVTTADGWTGWIDARTLEHVDA